MSLKSQSKYNQTKYNFERQQRRRRLGSVWPVFDKFWTYFGKHFAGVANFNFFKYPNISINNLAIWSLWLRDTFCSDSIVPHVSNVLMLLTLFGKQAARKKRSGAGSLAPIESFSTARNPYRRFCSANFLKASTSFGRRSASPILI